MDTLELGPLHGTHKPGTVLMNGEDAALRDLAGHALLPLPGREGELLQPLNRARSTAGIMWTVRAGPLGLRDDDFLAIEVDRGPGHSVLLSAADASPKRDVQLVDAMQSLVASGRDGPRE